MVVFIHKWLKQYAFPACRLPRERVSEAAQRGGRLARAPREHARAPNLLRYRAGAAARAWAGALGGAAIAAGYGVRFVLAAARPRA